MSNRKSILIADDEAINQMIFEEVLDEQFDLIFVSNGADCIDSVKAQRPDLILMDVCMPIMDGLEACKKIKALDGYHSLPIIFVSALAAQSEIDLGFEAGGDAYISKPFDEEELIDVINKHLDNN